MDKAVKLRSYVRKRNNTFVAANITLNIMCTGESADDAWKKLEELTIEYIREILEDCNSAEEFKECAYLFNRPAPFFMYKDYAICFIKHHLARTKDIFTSKKNYPLKFQLNH